MADQTYQPTLSQLRAFVARGRIPPLRYRGSAIECEPTHVVAGAGGARERARGAAHRAQHPSGARHHAGERLLGQAKVILEAADGFVATAAGVGDRLAGPLRIGLIPTVAPYVLPALLPALREEMPALEPQVIEDQTARLLEALRVGALDVAVLALPTVSAVSSIFLCTQKIS